VRAVMLEIPDAFLAERHEGILQVRAGDTLTEI
jgi:hypothetical protein